MKHKILLAAAVVIAMVSIYAANDTFYQEMAESFDVYSAVIKEVNINYVDELNINKLLRNSLDGMLSELDPYSVYLEEQEKESVEIISTGKYTGLGITVANIEGNLYITDILKDMPAYESGAKIGDMLFIIDNDTVQKLKSKDLKPYTSGTQGTFAAVKVIRQNFNQENKSFFNDTVSLSVKRDFIKVKNIKTISKLNDSIGYLKLERFSREAANEFRVATEEFKKQGVSNLIIDLRDNPGGLLEAAVGISELFLPEGSEIVSTRGRTKRSQYSYKSKKAPLTSDMKLAVLINQNSASASEIVAGAIQDYDRGLLVGKRSFGKGLVQSIFTLPYNRTLKLTTAKYYTPSGRCIQKIDYSQNNQTPQSNSKKDYENESDNENEEYEEIKPNSKTEAKPNTELYYTKNGRKVTEQLGITPDVFVNQNEVSYFTQNIERSGLLFLYGNQLQAENSYFLKTDFNSKKFWENSYTKLKEFLIKNKLFEKSRELDAIKNLEKEVKENKYSDNIFAEISLVENLITKEYYTQFDKNKEELIKLIKLEVLKRTFDNSYLMNTLLLDDEFVITSIENLKSPKYKKLLSIKEENSNDN